MHKHSHRTTSTDPLSLLVSVAHAMRKSRLHTVADIARLACTTRQSTYRVLAAMQREGYVRCDAKRWTLTVGKEAA